LAKRQRVPLSPEIEAKPTKTIDAEPMKEAAPVEDKSPAQQATPPSPTNEAAPPAPVPPKEPNAYPVGSGRSLFDPWNGHPSLRGSFRFGG